MFDHYIRRRSDTLETPIYQMDNRRTKSRISLVGMIHIGQQGYYDRIAEHVETTEQTGSVVHYEMVKKSENAGDVEPWIEEFQTTLSSGIGRIPIETMVKYLGCEKQLDALTYHPHWQNHDISIQELIRRAGPESMKKMVDGIKKFKDREEEMGEEATGRMIRKVFGLMPVLSRVNNYLELGDQHLKSVIIDHRNDVALQAVRSQITDEPSRDITMLWGAAHLPGIKSGLEQMGYRRSSKKWLAALALNNVAQ